MAGKWIATLSYRDSTNCSVAPVTLTYEFDSDPQITKQSDDICGSGRYNFSATATKMTRADGSVISQSVAGILCSTNSLYHSVSVQYIPDDEKFDCINGACISSNEYSTPGIYQSLGECEVNCGTGCSGKCIPNAEWAQIEGLSSQLKSINCS
ncbi:hypothetical protein NIES25_51710 [Nostoc linckia NIES-25]|nr:hypothetical protein NIES25_05850 [Nostoc linckia NIES-25]BAY78668.1 hypothetical protein NIES25_51440 [Nostoc linckia NIES-25]BAY78695.1 hypothetical protein NIES25_51710 [Nostoc linckia NIES-25]